VPDEALLGKIRAGLSKIKVRSRVTRGPSSYVTRVCCCFQREAYLARVLTATATLLPSLQFPCPATAALGLGTPMKFWHSRNFIVTVARIQRTGPEG